MPVVLLVCCFSGYHRVSSVEQDLPGKGQERGGTQYDGTSPKRRGGRRGDNAERFGPTGDVGGFGHAITTRFPRVYRLSVVAASSRVDPGVARHRVQCS